jgi:NAD(P)-dependent dehydrogenase (short-subunit alcohol dehydrogenase family)
MTQRQRLTGKVAVVTGAGRNIGRAEAMLLAAQGCRVVVNDVLSAGQVPEESTASAVVREIRDAGGEAEVVHASAGTMAAGKLVIDSAMDAFGRIDILVNNAGVVGPVRIDKMTEEEWHFVVDVSLKGSFATIRYASEHMIRQGQGGVIINTSSSSGFGHYGMTNYSAAKEGKVGLTRSAARDLGQFGIRCNTIRPVSHITGTFTPGIAETIRVAAELGQTLLWNRMHTGARLTALPEHVAALVVWLCTEAAAHVSGRDFFVQGDEIGLMPEPEMSRVVFQPGGWDLDSLDQPETVHYLVGDIPNRFVNAPLGEGA